MLKKRQIMLVLLLVLLLFNISIIIVLNSSIHIDIRYSAIESREIESGSLSTIGNSFLLKTETNLEIYDHSLGFITSQEMPDMVIPAVNNANNVITIEQSNFNTLLFRIYDEQLDFVYSKEVHLSRDLQDYNYQDLILAYVESQIVEISSHSLIYSYDAGEVFNNDPYQVYVIYEGQEYNVEIPFFAVSNTSQYIQADQKVFDEFVINDGNLYYLSALYTQNFADELQRKLYLNVVDIVTGTNSDTLLYSGNLTLTELNLRDFHLQGNHLMLSYEIADEGVIRQSSIEIGSLDYHNTDFECVGLCSDDIIFYDELIGIEYTILSEGSTMEMVKSGSSFELYSPEVYMDQRMEKVALPHILSSYALDQNNLLSVSAINMAAEKHALAIMLFTFTDDIILSQYEVGQLDIVDLYDLQVVDENIFAYLTYDRESQEYQMHAHYLELSKGSIPQKLFFWANSIVAFVVLIEYVRRKYMK